jgi:Rrf2 family protein
VLRINRDVEYALIVLAAMAERDRLRPARELSERFSIPPERLSKILQKLARSGLVLSTHGARGGYLLGRAQEEITVRDVIQALEGPLRITPCYRESRCERGSDCSIHDGVGRMQQLLTRMLGSFTLRDLVRRKAEEPAGGRAEAEGFRQAGPDGSRTEVRRAGAAVCVPTEGRGMEGGAPAGFYDPQPREPAV